eukprot:RCo016628
MMSILSRCSCGEQWKGQNQLECFAREELADMIINSLTVLDLALPFSSRHRAVMAWTKKHCPSWKLLSPPCNNSPENILQLLKEDFDVQKTACSVSSSPKSSVIFPCKFPYIGASDCGTESSSQQLNEAAVLAIRRSPSPDLLSDSLDEAENLGPSSELIAPSPDTSRQLPPPKPPSQDKFCEKCPIISSSSVACSCSSSVSICTVSSDGSSAVPQTAAAENGGIRQCATREPPPLPPSLNPLNPTISCPQAPSLGTGHTSNTLPLVCAGQGILNPFPPVESVAALLRAAGVVVISSGLQPPPVRVAPVPPRMLPFQHIAVGPGPAVNFSPKDRLPVVDSFNASSLGVAPQPKPQNTQLPTVIRKSVDRTEETNFKFSPLFLELARRGVKRKFSDASPTKPTIATITCGSRGAHRSAFPKAQPLHSPAQWGGWSPAEERLCRKVSRVLLMLSRHCAGNLLVPADQLLNSAELSGVSEAAVRRVLRLDPWQRFLLKRGCGKMQWYVSPNLTNSDAPEPVAVRFAHEIPYCVCGILKSDWGEIRRKGLTSAQPDRFLVFAVDLCGVPFSSVVDRSDRVHASPEPEYFEESRLFAPADGIPILRSGCRIFTPGVPEKHMLPVKYFRRVEDLATGRTIRLFCLPKKP